MDAGRLQLGVATGAQPRQFGDAVGRPRDVAGAMAVVGASVWIVAVVARSDGRRLGPCERGAHCPCLPTDAVEQCGCLVQHRMQLEQRIDIQLRAVVDIAPVERKHGGFPHIHPNATQHPKLNGDVQHVNVLGSGGGLHLHQSPTAVGQPFQHVVPNQHVLVLERTLEDGRRHAGVDDPPRLRQRLRHVLMVMGDQVPTGIPPTGQLAYFMAGVEDELQRLVDWRSQLAGVEVPPQPQMALAAG